jgi:hypothetical protein
MADSDGRRTHRKVIAPTDIFRERSGIRVLSLPLVIAVITAEAAARLMAVKGLGALSANMLRHSLAVYRHSQEAEPEDR